MKTWNVKAADGWSCGLLGGISRRTNEGLEIGATLRSDDEEIKYVLAVQSSSGRRHHCCITWTITSKATRTKQCARRQRDPGGVEITGSDRAR